jgi:hypothetical protein
MIWVISSLGVQRTGLIVLWFGSFLMGGLMDVQTYYNPEKQEPNHLNINN